MSQEQNKEHSQANMLRLRLDLAYDGTHFHGWASQDGLRTVEGEIRQAFETIFQTPVKVTVAGRTDAGVHAKAQVATVDLPGKALERAGIELVAAETAEGESGGTERAGIKCAGIERAGVEPVDIEGTNHAALDRLLGRVNRLLAAGYAKHVRTRHVKSLPQGDSDVVIHSLQPVSDDFDARFSATGRHYQYLIVDTPANRDPLARADRWWAPRPLDHLAMQEAAAKLLGTHDFLSFCKPRDGATTIRTLRQLDVSRDATGTITINVNADAFCHSMVRALVGALVEVGSGRQDPAWVKTLVEDPSRDHGVPVAPAHGLSLVSVTYPPPEQWAQAASEARRVRTSDEVDEKP